MLATTTLLNENKTKISKTKYLKQRISNIYKRQKDKKTKYRNKQITNNKNQIY